jgi:hypothetical protein
MTVNKAISVANPGNLISVANGSYAEIATFTSKSGLNACHLVLQSANPQGAVLFGARLTSSNFVDIQNFKFTNQTASTPAGYGVYISGTSHDDTVTGDLITQLCHEGIYEEPTVGTNILLNLNTISFAQMAGINVDGSGTTASNNDISQTQEMPKAVGGIYSVCQAFSPGNDDADWIRVFHSGHRILNNNLHDIPHNTVANPLGTNEPHTDCFQTFGSAMTNSVFNANTCIGSDPASHTTWDEEVSSFEGTVTGNTFENNVFANLHQGFELDGSPQNNNHYYNNTFDHMTLEALVYGVVVGAGETVENNEFYDVGGGGDGVISCSSATLPTWTTNNATMRSGSVGTFCESCTCPSSTTLAPGFLSTGTINGTGADYHLCLGNNSPAGSTCTALSPLADVATTISSFQTDHDGVSRPQGSGWSIGAYEQVPLPSTATPTPTASPSPTPIPQTLLITSPTNGSTVRVTTTVLDTNSNSKCGGLSWYDELWIDGVHTIDGAFSSTAFNPATHLGSHTLKIYAHTINQQGGPQGYDCDSSNTITVTGATPTPTPTASPTATGATATPTPSPTPVPSATPTGSTQFLTLLPGASLPSGSFCANAATALNIPEHASYNHDDGSPAHWNSLLPPASLPSYYHANAPGGSEMPNSDFNLVDGNYTGTTEDTFAWASCKWGIMLDVIRAQAQTESGGWHGDCAAIHGGNALSCPEAGDYNSPPGNNCGLPVTSITPGGCFTALNGLGACRNSSGTVIAMTGNDHCASWNVIQTKDWYQWMTYPMNTVSLPFGVDHRYAEMRGCMNGDQFSYFHSQNVASGADYQNAVNLAKSNPSGPAPSSHTIPLDFAGETNLQYLQWKCDGTHFSGGWTTAMNGYLTTTLGHFNSHDWPGGLHQ